MKIKNIFPDVTSDLVCAVCQTGLQRCYDTFGDISGEIEQYMAGTDQHSRSWCK